MFYQVRKQAYYLIFAQVGTLVFLFLFWIIFYSWRSAVSSILGSAAVIFPSWYFIHKFFSNKQRTAQQMIKDFYVGELLKLLLSAILLVLFVHYLPVKLIPVLSGYVAAYLAIWLLFIKWFQVGPRRVKQGTQQ